MLLFEGLSLSSKFVSYFIKSPSLSTLNMGVAFMLFLADSSASTIPSGSAGPSFIYPKGMLEPYASDLYLS